LVQLLEGVVNNGTGRAARLGRRAAGKTGTTQDFRDAWFIGFTTDMVVGVWVGNDDNSPMDKVVGGDLPAKIWYDYVDKAQQIIAAHSAAAVPRPAGAFEGLAAPGGRSPSSEPKVAEPPAILRGVPTVADTGTLVFSGGVAHLDGVEGEKGEPARQMMRYIRGREVVCEPVEPRSAQYRCKIDNIDLGEAVLLNGAGRAAANAPDRLFSAEEKAQLAGRGIWRD
jgi:penicillin-binding protein 1A